MTESEEGFSEVEGPPSTALIQSYFEGLDIKLLAGQQAEVNLEAVRWMEKIGEVLNQGYVLTFDYGHTATDLYAFVRKKGTLLCYYRHTVGENPYEHIGEQDITTHVDFSTLAAVGRKVGLEVAGFTDQQHFLMSMGITEEMDGMDPQSGDFKVMRHLIADSAMGRTFKLLIQQKGMSQPELKGLRYKPFFKNSLGC